MMLGVYFAAVALVASILRALPELPEKLREETWRMDADWWSNLGEALLLLVAVFGFFLLLGAGIGWLCYRVELDAEKRRNASKQPLIVRR